MSDVKQVKVDNWGIYFLQRLKHFFNRTDYCDLTLQFQDNAQLKVHRLVLSACTEYFELLERTCEMYEDCLVMPDDLQADVVVPIVNFMYTGHLEFRMDLLERLYQTSQILNMPVLSKLLESHRNLAPKVPTHSYSSVVKKFPKHSERPTKVTPPASVNHKRSFSKAFENNVVYKENKKNYQPAIKPESIIVNNSYNASSSNPAEPMASQKVTLGEPRPTRYELPEELDTGNIFDNSFCSISYESQPLMIHPDTVKRYSAKRNALFSEASSSKKSGMSTVDIVECKRVTKQDNIFDDSIPDHSLTDDTELFQTSYTDNVQKDPNQLFDQIIDQNDGPKVTIETKDSKTASNLDHARIISEVLKKYPHLVKSNKNIKLKILDPSPCKPKKQQQKPSPVPQTWYEEKPLKLKTEQEPDYTYETDVIDSKQAAKLIAMGAENTKGPWICLICGTPGKALHFSSYFKFRRHLVEVHNEKPVSNICEYCGLRSTKRNYLLHHLYAQHGVAPPPQYHFPKCNQCNYVALTESLLIKHKMTHRDIRNFRCNVCASAFSSSNQLLLHIQATGHKYSAERKRNLQCIYCLRVFLRETNLYAHIKTHHKKEAKNDGVIDDSDEETLEEKPKPKSVIKFEPSTSYDNEYEEVELQYQIQQRPVSSMQVSPRKPQNIITNTKQKILNPGFDSPKSSQKAKPKKIIQPLRTEIQTPNNQEEEIVVIGNNEYIMRDNQLIPKKRKSGNSDFVMADVVNSSSMQTIQEPTTSMQYSNVQNTNIEENVQQSSMIIKKSGNINQPIQIVVSNEEEYKALMASNHPIIFDDGEQNKTLTVLTTPHNQTIDTTSIDLDNTTSNEMMIIPDQYPLNVNEAVTNDNSNIVVVYSHSVDENKQFQILTTGGIGAQFVQPSAIITQNYETVTTSTSAMSAHCIEVEAQQSWRNNVQSIQNQHIQLPPVTAIRGLINSDQVEIKPIHSASENNLDDLPEVHIISEEQTLLPPQENESEMSGSPSNVNIEHINQNTEQETAEVQQNISEELINSNGTCERDVDNEMAIITVTNNPDQTHPDIDSIPVILSNDENCMIEGNMLQENSIQPPTENIMIHQQRESENNIQTSMETDNNIQTSIKADNEIQLESDGIQQSIQTENQIQKPMESDNVIQPSMEIVIEIPSETENVMAPIDTENVSVPTVEAENDMEESMVAGDEQAMAEEQVQVTVEENQQSMVIENRQAMVATNFVEQTVIENVIEQTVADNDIEQPLSNANFMQQSMDTENAMNDLRKTDTYVAESIKIDDMVVVPQEVESVKEQPLEPVNIILQQTPPLSKEIILDNSENIEIVATTNDTEAAEDENQDMTSQAYDEIVVINRELIEEPVNVKEAEEKIQNLTSEWSEDEYDVPEDNTLQKAENTPHEGTQNPILVTEQPELEESIENIQQEMNKPMVVSSEMDGETEESAISSQEEDSSSQEMQLPATESSALTDVPNPQAIQKLSSLLNDWEDNDSQEETIPVAGNAITTIGDTNSNAHISDEQDTSNCLPSSKESAEVTNNDPIKSLVSDWDDDDEEIKE